MADTFSITMKTPLKHELSEVVESGRHGDSRSAVISYYVKRGIELEKYEERGLEFLVDFFKVLENNPSLIEKFREFIEKK